MKKNKHEAEHQMEISISESVQELNLGKSKKSLQQQESLFMLSQLA